MAYKESDFNRVCIINNMYGLLQYLLISTEEEIDSTFFFFAEDVQEKIVQNFTNSVKLVTPSSTILRFFYLVRLRYCIRRKYPFLKVAEFYGQDNLLITPPLLANNQMTVVEDGMANYTIVPPLKRFRWARKLLIGKLMGERSLGYSTSCKKIYLTGMAAIPQELRKKAEIINLQNLWDTSTPAKRNKIFRKFNLSKSLINEFKASHSVLLTQPLSEDRAVTEQEKIDIYKKIIDDNQNISIKPHPRERTDYTKYFPSSSILYPHLPIELLSIMGVRFSDVYTVFSTSALGFPNKPNIHFMGTRIHENLVRKWGDVRYVDGTIKTINNKHEMRNKIIVIGGDHHNTLGVIRSLGEEGLRPDLILVTKSKSTFVDSSKYIERCWTVDSDESAVQLLLDNYQDSAYKPVIICCSDSSSGTIDDNLNKLKQHFFLPGASCEGRISEMMNKRRMAELACECGILPPPTFYISDADCQLDDITLPCIIKPIVSRNGSKEDIKICYTREALQVYIAENDISNCQIQSFVDKDFEYQLIGCSTKSEVIIPGVSKILRPCKGSNTSFLYYEPLQEGFCDIEKYKELIRRTGYHGLFSIEFLRDKKGQDYFLEINFRNDGNAICVKAAGLNLPYIWYLDCLGKDYKCEAGKLIKPVYVLPDIAELKLLLTRQISLKDYIVDIRKTNRFMEYDRFDPKPFWKLLKIKCK